jgi:hypothetical protein
LFASSSGTACTPDDMVSAIRQVFVGMVAGYGGWSKAATVSTAIHI